ncbi:hypothetical protein [Helicobacter sp. UBA3407]|uniref:hypothetical protein n=1 Tax=Helicobacter TaxID=209 RepID=UPI002620D87B|nr:hypothetical protein [Helicobacter sp. UBA3407]
MKNVKIFNYAFCILSIGILFAGCVISQNIKATPEAERVTYLQTIPNDCKFLGEIHAEAGGKELHTHYVNSLNEYNFKQSVDIQLRNRAAKFGENVKIVIKDKKEICKRQRAFRNLDHQTTSDCESLKKIYPDEAFLVYLEITANLYQCQK